jgi:hypothetical protein
VQAHPTLTGVQTLRLTSSATPTQKVVLTAGFKWNLVAAWLLSAHVSHPLSDAGLNAAWVPALSLDYLIGR